MAIQVYVLKNRKRNILKHIGSGAAEEVNVLKARALNWIETEINNKGLFPLAEDMFSRNYQYLGFSYQFAYEFLSKVFLDFNFRKHTKKIFYDLVIAQILEPASKRGNLSFLRRFFGIKHNLNNLYAYLSIYDPTLKDNLEKEALRIAERHFAFDFSFVLYDVIPSLISRLPSGMDYAKLYG